MAATASDGFGTALKRLRLAAGLTQEALAERAGVSAKAISDLERDPNRAPRLDTVTLLAEALALDAAGRAHLLAAARPDRAPPAALASAADHGAVPRPLTPLFGRDGVTAAVAEIVRRGDDRLLTLTGPGGVGKTRLAIAAAERVAAAFPDGVVFVDLAPLRDWRHVLTTIARRLGLDERDAGPLPGRLAASLHRRRLLLLLDNFEHLLPARDAVLSLLEASPTLAVLATSRVPLRVRGEREYRVAPLAMPEESDDPEALARAPAAALFLDRARAAGADLALTPETGPVVAQICRRLDGLPLAVELAAAWTRLLPPPALLARLDRRLPLLVGGPHDLPARQRTMRDTIAWSYELLTEDERRLFRRLCVFAGGLTVEAAEWVSGVGCRVSDEDAPATAPQTRDSRPETLVLLAALVDRSLLRAPSGSASHDASPRLTILETLREYGLERMEESAEVESARDAHAAYFAALAETADSAFRESDGGAWDHRLDADHDNLRAALDWSIVRGDRNTTLRLAGAMWRFWDARGHLGEGRRWLRLALETPAGPGDEDGDVRINALIGAARLALAQGAYDEAALRCAQAVEFAWEHGGERHLIAALNTRGHIARERGEYVEAAHCHEEALALAEAAGDRAASAEALTGLGYAAMFSGDVASGAEFCERSVAAFRALGDTRGLAGALIAVAGAHQHAGAFARSEAAGAEALGLFRLLGDTGQMADALWVLGTSALVQEHHERATPYLKENLALRQDRGDEHGTVQPLPALALIALRQGDHGQARTLVQETLAILERYDDRWSQAMSLTTLGHVELAAGDPARAAARLLEAAPLFREIGNPLYVPWCLEGLAGVAAARGLWEMAARLCGARDALHASLRLGVPPVHPAGYAQTMADCRAALSDEAFAAAYAAGESLPPDAAIAEAACALAPSGSPSD